MYTANICAGFTTTDDIEQFHVTLNEWCEAEVQQVFTVDDVTAVCSHLKACKKNADLDLFSDAIINAPCEFHVVLCNVIHAVLAMTMCHHNGALA